MYFVTEDTNSLVGEFNSLSDEYKKLKQLHKSYSDTMGKLFALQSKCNKEMDHQKYRLSTVTSYLNYCEKEELAKHPEMKQSVIELRENISQRKVELKDIANSLPQSNSGHLKVIMGSANLSMLSQTERFNYKDDYEKFKFTVQIIGMVLAIMNVLVDSDFLAILFKFLLVWYYCILTLRESILKLNGSRIKGWKRYHHFVFIALSGLLLLWPENDLVYVKHFRPQLLSFGIYMSFVQFLQFKYQKEVLYRLRALGKGHNMDITVNGFHSFMFRGLGFLLPFHIILYIFEFSNAKVLWTLWLTHPEATWHLPVIGFLFLVIVLGNIYSLMKAIPRKFRERRYLKSKLAFAVSRMRKASAAASLSVAVEKFRRLSSATTLANFSHVFSSITKMKSSDKDTENDDLDLGLDYDDDLVFDTGKQTIEKVSNQDKITRYPLKKFLHLSHRIF